METYQIRVLDGQPVAGYAHDGARLRVMPGEYEGYCRLTAFNNPLDS